jgi:outer membrane protein assembly factor BamB
MRYLPILLVGLAMPCLLAGCSGEISKAAPGAAEVSSAPGRKSQQVAKITLAQSPVATEPQQAKSDSPGPEKTQPPKGWPFFRGPNGNGIVDVELDLLPEPKQLWTVNVGRGNASFVIQDGRLYTIGNRGGGGSILCCLNAETGKTIWERKIETYAFDSSPAVENGRIYLLCHLGKPKVRCFQTSDGSLIWERELPAPTSDRHYGHAGSPLLWKDLVIVNVGLGVALKKSDGEVVWQHEGLPGLATPVLYHEKGKASVMIFGGDTLVARDLATGSLLWTVPWKTELAVNACDPIYSDGKVFLCTTYGKHAALFDVATKPARQLWKEDGSSFSSGFLWQDHLYCFAGDHFCCLKFASGERQWRGPGAGGGSVIVAGSNMILLSSRGALFIAPLSNTQWKPIVEARIHGGTTWTPPSLVDGRLYVRNNDGEAVCLQIGNEK